MRIVEEVKMIDEKNSKEDKILNILLGLSCVIAVFLKVYKIDSIPIGFHVDETGSIYDAWSLLTYGVDRWRIPWPVYFLNYGSGQNALYTYMLVPLFAIFGISKAVVRTPALISSFFLLTGGIGIIKISWRENWHAGRRKAAILFFVLLYAFTPYPQMAGRIGLESLLMLGFSTFSLFLLLLAADRRSTLAFFVSGVFWGLTLYSYAISYLVVPLFLLFAGIYLLRKHRVTGIQAIVFIAPLFLLAFPLILEQYVNMFDKDSIQLGIFTVTKLTGYRGDEFTLSNIPGNLFLTIKSMLFYDWLDYNTVKEFWTFFPISVPFFFVGLGKHIITLHKEEDKTWQPSLFVLIWFLLMVLVSCTLGEKGRLNTNPNTNKINGIFFATMFYIVLGFMACFFNWRKVRWKQVAGGAVLALYLFFSARFVHYYFVYYTPDDFWCHQFPESAKIIDSSETLSEKPVYSVASIMDYLLSSPKSPYEIDFADDETRNTYQNWVFSIMEGDMEELVFENGENASYLTWMMTDKAYAYLKELGFEMRQEGVYTLYYRE